MKINKLFYILAFIAVFALSVFAKTSADRSSIIIEYTSSGWTGINAGWSEDECLISPTHTLDYALHATNRYEYSLSNSQYMIGPEFEENWGEMITNQWDSRDCNIPCAAEDGTTGDISEFWITWDANWLYCGVKGQMRNEFETGSGAGQGVNIIVVFDIDPAQGIVDFIKEAVWEKGVYLRGFDADQYAAAWYSHSGNVLGDLEYYYKAKDDREALYEYENVSHRTVVDGYYNASYEADVYQRVLLFKLNLSVFTNNLSTLTSLTLKTMVAVVDGKSGGASYAYDYCPNNLAGMNSDRKTVADNYFAIPFTDTNGQLLMDVRPRYDGMVKYLPGSRSFSLPTFTIGLKATNISLGLGYPRSIFVPQKGERASISVTLPKNSNVFEAEIKVYSLRGEVMGVIKSATEGDDGGAWLVSGAVENETFSYTWDGKNQNGDYVPMGTYLAVFSGMKEDGIEWSERKYISVMH